MELRQISAPHVAPTVKNTMNNLTISDYSVLYDYVDMEQLLCHSCWNEEKPVRIDDDTIHIFRPSQMHAVRIKCLRCDTDVTVQNGCAGCFPAG